MRSRFYIALCALLFVTACVQQPTELAPVTPGNVDVVPEDEGPVGKATNGTYKTIILPEEPVHIDYSGTSN